MNIGFIGLGNMGAPMAANLVKSGNKVYGFDLNQDFLDNHKKIGGYAASSIENLAELSEVIILSLPAGKHVAAVCGGEHGIFKHATKGTLIIDCSTIDVPTSKELAAEARRNDLSMIDAPVSGGVTGAKSATLTFMVGGEKKDYETAMLFLKCMGTNFIYVGQNGAGVGAKIANNMMLGVAAVATAEAVSLAIKVGVDPKKFYDIASTSTSTGSCWALNNCYPIPGITENSPANNDYNPGFSSALLLKDLKLARDSATTSKHSLLMNDVAIGLYESMVNNGLAGKDFSALITVLYPEAL
ncbi:3-hydroxyisobutyrate dehydrogenase [Dongshaea marina]|uniref:3-hydroxyisobutyrate dehydrogenase n=1 Tax=Dongshaea marina TaxID=2047966 RepID=UPI000D3ECDF5|nr:3-hydroxyisobutyrate dehydrogenase [Dongshaea marina]